MNDFHISNKVLKANTLLILTRIFIKRIIWKEVKYLKNYMYVRVYKICYFIFPITYTCIKIAVNIKLQEKNLYEDLKMFKYLIL